jgi:cell wall-associated NlpC family hydrolase
MARRPLTRRLVVAGAFMVVARWAVAQGEARPVPIEVPDDVPEAAVATVAPRPAFRRRLATSLVFATLFFAGAAFTAGAGNELAQIDAASTDTTAVVDAAPPADATATDATTTDATPTDATTTDVADAVVPSAAPTVVTAPVPAEVTPAAAAPVPATADPAPAVPAASADPSDAVLLQPKALATTAPVAAAPAAHPSPQAAVRRHARRAVASAPVRVAIVAIPFQALTFDPAGWLHDNAASPTGASAVAIAQHYLGVPYRWGGAMPGTGFDCSGLTRFVYAQLGVSLPHYAAAQFAAFPRLDPAELQPGDLVFFEPKFDGPGHVALYIGNDQIIEAPHTGALIRISSLSGAAAAMGFLGAVRPYADTPGWPVGSTLVRLY